MILTNMRFFTKLSFQKCCLDPSTTGKSAILMMPQLSAFSVKLLLRLRLSKPEAQLLFVSKLSDFRGMETFSLLLKGSIIIGKF